MFFGGAMELKKITVQDLKRITGLSVNEIAHRIGCHTNYLYKLSAQDKNLFETTKVVQVAKLLEEFMVKDAN